MGGLKVYPTEEKKLLNSLTEEQIRVLKKDYPFKKERNLLICELRQRGVAYPVLVKVTGMTKSSVHRIGSTGINGCTSVKDQQLQAASMKEVRKAFNAFRREIEKILQTERR